MHGVVAADSLHLLAERNRGFGGKAKKIPKNISFYLLNHLVLFFQQNFPSKPLRDKTRKT
jgi:hypothetical protein